MTVIIISPVPVVTGMENAWRASFPGDGFSVLSGLSAAVLALPPLLVISVLSVFVVAVGVAVSVGVGVVVIVVLVWPVFSFSCGKS
jgi:hypothetical protein